MSSSAVTPTSSTTGASAGRGSSTPGASECPTRARRTPGGPHSARTASSSSRRPTTRSPRWTPSREPDFSSSSSGSSPLCSGGSPRPRRPTSSSAGVVARSYVGEARRRGLGTRRERIGPIVERLAREHADATIALRFASDVELLISVMLSAQTTDVNVNRVTKQLFRKYRRPEDYLAVPVEELERDVYATGFYRQKTKSIRGAMRMLIEEFDGKVPRTMDELLRLPGVARKTANVVAAELGSPQGVVVDTHVRRLSQRLGFTRQDDPVKIERDLQRLVPRAKWGIFPHLLIWHGRRVCSARRPLCEECVVNDLCPSSRVPVGRAGG